MASCRDAYGLAGTPGRGGKLNSPHAMEGVSTHTDVWDNPTKHQDFTTSPYGEAHQTASPTSTHSFQFHLNGKDKQRH